jgi:hypothetical protein
MVVGSSPSLKTIWMEGCTGTDVAPVSGDVETTVGTVESGAKVTFAEAVWVESAWLVAVTDTFPGVGSDTGGVYRPFESIVPTILLPPAVPFTPQATVSLATPMTVALNCCE